MTREQRRGAPGMPVDPVEELTDVPARVPQEGRLAPGVPGQEIRDVDHLPVHDDPEVVAPGVLPHLRPRTLR